jgi:hypothetical protein
MEHRFLFSAVAYWQLFAASVWRRTANVTAQYSSANMMVMTRSVTEGSVGSGE